MAYQKLLTASRLVCLSVLCTVLGCKPFETPVSEQTDAEDALAIESERNADSTQELTSNAAFFFAVYDEQFTTKLSDLPPSGEERSVPNEKIPYSGHWYPEANGGTNVTLRTGEASPLKKYDLAFHGGTPRAQTWENANHRVPPTHESAGWAGHCNGFSAAAQRHQEPYLSVQKNGVTFEPHDIKALLAEIYMSAKFFFLGGRRCEQRGGSVPRPMDRANPERMELCEDINPGTFHAALANWIGIKQRTIIMDTSTTYEVWNYPVYKYKSDYTAITRDEAVRLITGRTDGDYQFNPKANAFARVTTTITYSDTLRQEQLGKVAPFHRPQARTYTYVLELDGALTGGGHIIGGEWIGASQLDHPDFMWVALEPVAGPGTRFYGNPYVDVDEVIKLWAESVGADPNNPPLDITEPKLLADWGKYDHFDITIDGASTGAVFLGKKIKAVVKRRGDFVGAMALDVELNGSNIASMNLSGSDDVEFTVPASYGLNRIALRWSAEGREPKGYSVRFHAMP